MWSGKICNGKEKEVSKVRFSADFLNTSQDETNECVRRREGGERRRKNTHKKQTG